MTPLYKNPKVVAAFVALLLAVIEAATGVLIPGSV